MNDVIWYECAYCGFADTDNGMYIEYDGQLYCSLHDPEREDKR